MLGTELPWLDKVESAKTLKRLPVVFTREDVQKILGRLQHALACCQFVVWHRHADFRGIAFAREKY